MGNEQTFQKKNNLLGEKSNNTIPNQSLFIYQQAQAQYTNFQIAAESSTIMDFIYSREHINMDEIAVVDCDMQSNVMLTNDANFNKFSNGSKYTYYGGFYTHFPAQITPPKAGYWYITIDLGVGYEGKYNYLIKIETD